MTLRLLLILLPLFLNACAHNATSCANVDWYEVGRWQGLKGEKAKKTNSCLKTPSYHTTYLNGHAAGTSEYCQVNNSYQLGRMGLKEKFSHVCSKAILKNLFESYKKGQEKHKEEQKQSQLILQSLGL